MLTHLKLSNFKAFESVQIDFKPLTIILGPNNSGKSSLLAAPRLLSQTVQSYDNTVPLLLNGIMGDFGTFRDIVYTNHRAKRISIELGITSRRVALRRADPSYVPYSVRLIFKYRSGRREIVLAEVETKRISVPILAAAFSDDSERHLLTRVATTVVPAPMKSSLSRDLRIQNFLPRVNVHTSQETSDKSDDSFWGNPSRMTARMRSNTAATAFVNVLGSIEYLGAMRVAPARTYLYSGERRTRVGAAGEYTTNILALDAARGGVKSRELLHRVSKWMLSAKMASALEIASISDRHFELRIKHHVTNESQNYADVGFGHSQVLPVLVGGFNLDPHSIFIVEQPEIHLHPRAQAELGDFFQQLYSKQIQCIVETHSEHLVLRLQQHVACGRIKSSDINVYYVYPTEGRKRVVQLKLDDDGRFVDEWPEGFFPERLEEAKHLAQARFERSGVRR